MALLWTYHMLNPVTKIDLPWKSTGCKQKITTALNRLIYWWKRAKMKFNHLYWLPTSGPCPKTSRGSWLAQNTSRSCLYWTNRGLYSTYVIKGQAEVKASHRTSENTQVLNSTWELKNTRIMRRDAARSCTAAPKHAQLLQAHCTPNYSGMLC
jgi:hypothetical protein